MEVLTLELQLQHLQLWQKRMINIEMISTSEIKVSMVIEQKYAELAVRTLHSVYELDK